MAKVLTAISVENLRADAKRYERPDGGCRGLYVVVQPSGVKSWCVRYRYRGRPTKLTLGSVLIEPGAEPNAPPELGTPLGLRAARELATKALREVAAGIDPAAQKRKRRADRRAADADTLQAIAEEFLRREAIRFRTFSQRKADLELLYPSLGRLLVTEIKRGMITRVLDRIADERGPVRADRVLAATKRLLSWHADRSDYVSVLGRGGRRTSITDRARSRVLSDDELRRIWTTAEKLKTPFAGFAQFVLLTGTRRAEAAGLRRTELSDDERTWIIPGSRYKSGRDTSIPLSKAAQGIIAVQPPLGDFVFSATGERALGGFGKRKADFDKASGVGGWTIHDLRRTARTLLSRAGINADMAERCLGHALVGVRATYDRYAYQAEKAAAFEALAAQIERIVHPPKATVTDMAEARKRRQRR
jgi:integrase